MFHKTCEICGSEFDTEYKIQKYCNECKGHPNNARRKMMAAIVTNRHHAGEDEKIPEYFHSICLTCGKEFQALSQTQRYCSRTCMEQDASSNARCLGCGKPILYHYDNEYSLLRNRKYCSKECQLKVEREKAMEEGRVRECPTCHKIFPVISTSSDQTFCSRECYHTYQKTHLKQKRESDVPSVSESDRCPCCGKPRKKGHRFCSDECYEKMRFGEKKSELYSETRICVHCGKEFQASKMDGGNQKYCSPQCRKEHTYQMQREKRGSSRGKNNADIPSLCVSCRTAYPDCEFVSSGYRAYPVGAIVCGGRVTRCPKYTE